MYNLKPAKWGLRQNSRSFAIFGQHSTKMAWNKISGLYISKLIEHAVLKSNIGKISSNKAIHHLPLSKEKRAH